ncbi:Cse1-domain-containing protein [Limtongia smithiae]|uniref:Cse1-domain-containing protein n=1 Tax=Limtongia smithiae TaxID=1125753 RepID=UPI0034CD9FCF
MSLVDIQSIASLLEASLHPSTAKQAEQSLRSTEAIPGFSVLLLQIVASDAFPQTIRLASALFFKNFIRRKWTNEDGNYLISESDVVSLKADIVGLMITVPPSLQVQLGEAISIMADSDFPDRWQRLLDDLISRLGFHNPTVTNGVLQVAHSIFKRWRPLYRSDELFVEIKFVLDKFCVPFLAVFRETDAAIAANAKNKDILVANFKNLQLIIKIYYDLNCQDIPEFFEDNMTELMGWILKYLQYTNPLLETGFDDEAGPLEEVKTSICELIQLYSQRYEDVWGSLLPSFVETTWNLLTTTGTEPKYDMLMSRALAFLTTVAKSPDRAQVFSSREILQQIVEKIVLPNMSLRTSDEELFEDDPIEYTRRDLDGSDSDTRRRAATDFLRELKERFEGLVTEVVMSYVQHYLEQYAADRNANWSAKDTAVYLFSSVAVKGTVTASGVSATNLLLDVVGFFSQNIAPDLLRDDTHAILRVDAIKFIHTFRNQLTKQQLTEAFPVLSGLLMAPEYVVYTYAAITIERILSIRQASQKNALLFDKDDIAPVAEQLLGNLLRLIEKGTTPEKLAENEFLMKCVMRVIITAKESIVPYADTIIQHLAGIISETSKNPSNPKFTHYTFESVGVVIRFAGPSKPPGTFDETLMPGLLAILGQDVTEFVPYVFQLLSVLLDVATPGTPLPAAYLQLVRPLLAPTLWETKGNAPALTRLLQSILARDALVFVNQGLVEAVLGVFQKLLASRVSDVHGFALLECIFYYMPMQQLETYKRQIALLILQRLQASRTDKLIVNVTRLLYFLSAITDTQKNLGPDYAVNLLDQAQPGIFGEVFSTFMIPCSAKFHANAADRKLLVVGLARILFESAKFGSQYSNRWCIGATALVTALQSDSLVDVYSNGTTNASAVFAEIMDLEDEVSFGATFARLSTVTAKPLDPAPELAAGGSGEITTLKQYVGAEVKRFGDSLSGFEAQLSDEVRSTLIGYTQL